MSTVRLSHQRMAFQLEANALNPNLIPRSDPVYPDLTLGSPQLRNAGERPGRPGILPSRTTTVHHCNLIYNHGMLIA